MASGQYHVFVEGPVDAGPGADEALARAMQQRYGLPASDVLARLRKGRFRVKGNIDERTAGAYARDLARIGARVVVEELPDAAPSRPSGVLDLHGSTPSGGVPRSTTPPRGTTTPPDAIEAPPPKTISPRRASTPPKQAQQRTTTPPQRAASPPQVIERTRAPSQRAATPPRGAATSTPAPASAPSQRTATPPRGAPAGAPTSTPAPSQSGPIRSGLAAAFEAAPPAPASLGALEQGAGALSLAALDGSDHSSAPAGGTFEPPPQPTAAPAPPPAPPPEELKPPTVRFAPSQPSAPPPRPQSTPLDMFAPPPGDTEMPELALEDVAKPVPTPAPASPPLRRSEPSLPRIRPAAEPPALIARPSTPRWRFAAGVAIAIVLGFVPAHLVASWREHSADRSIDQRVGQLYEQATTDEALAALDGELAPIKASKQAAHRNAALLAMLVWAAAGAGIGYAWFRRIPWRS